MHRLARVRVRGAGARIDAHHLAVADRGEQHDREGEEIRKRHDAVGFSRHDAERVEHDGRRHVTETEADDGPHPQRALELAAAMRRQDGHQPSSSDTARCAWSMATSV